MANLERAIAIALDAHAGVKDKAGNEYILHPLRVMLSVSGLEARIVGVLHDVVEDAGSRWSFERLAAEGFSQEVLDGLRAVTKLVDEEDLPGDDAEAKQARYARFIERAGGHPIGREVKIADLKDNMDLSRIANPTEKDFKRTEKYRRAIATLTD